MKNKEMEKRLAEEAGRKQVKSAVDLWRLMGGGQSRALREKGERKAADSMLAVYGERATYTFIMDEEVASIHFDRRRGEIFFKGHNIRNMELTKGHLAALEHMKEVLAGDRKAKSLLSDYNATLGRCLADNK